MLMNKEALLAALADIQQAVENESLDELQLAISKFGKLENGQRAWEVFGHFDRPRGMRLAFERSVAAMNPHKPAKSPAMCKG